MNAFTESSWRKQTACAMLLLCLGQLVSVLGTVWSKVPALVTLSTRMLPIELTNDFLPGFCFGVGIAINVFAIVLLLFVAKGRMGQLPKKA